MPEPVFEKWDNTSFYLTRKVYYFLGVMAALFAISFFVPVLFPLAQVLLLGMVVAVAADAALLYQRRGLSAERILNRRFSISDDNAVEIRITNSYPFAANLTVIDELPYQLQPTNWRRRLHVPGNSAGSLQYFIRPTERGEYGFGHVNLYLDGPLQFVKRRFRCGAPVVVKVYPSFRQMRRYQLIAVADHLQQTGVKRLRKIGHSMEFEQIKEYVSGDDFRTINWKATGRRGNLMVNSYTEEKSQQVYCLINKGRVMKMPFEGMTLLDYSINASLAISGVALQKGDKVGLICFSQQVDSFIPADKKATQVNLILETLYKQETSFMEPDYEKLFSAVRNRISHRSLLLLFTNYESFYSLERELPLLKRLAHYHLLMVVFFENTELKQFTDSRAGSTEEIYIQTIAEKYRYEKQMVVKELQKNGILTLLTTPQNLSINLLNKYLELKNRQSI